MKPTTKKSNLDRFMEVYREELTKSVLFYPGDFAYGVENVGQVSDRLEAALRESRMFMKDSRAVEETCRKLRIPHTYIGIKDYIANKTVEKGSLYTTLTQLFRNQNFKLN